MTEGIARRAPAPRHEGIRRQDVKGFVKHKPLWLTRPLDLDEVRKYAETIELEWARFYRKAAQSARDSSIRELLD